MSFSVSRNRSWSFLSFAVMAPSMGDWWDVSRHFNVPSWAMFPRDIKSKADRAAAKFAVQEPPCPGAFHAGVTCPALKSRALGAKEISHERRGVTGFDRTGPAKGTEPRRRFSSADGCYLHGSGGGRAAVRRLQHLHRRRRDRHQGHDLSAVPPAVRRAADRARLRIRQRLPD